MRYTRYTQRKDRWIPELKRANPLPRKIKIKYNKQTNEQKALGEGGEIHQPMSLSTHNQISYGKGFNSIFCLELEKANLQPPYPRPPSTGEHRAQENEEAREREKTDEPVEASREPTGKPRERQKSKRQKAS